MLSLLLTDCLSPPVRPSSESLCMYVCYPDNNSKYIVRIQHEYIFMAAHIHIYVYEMVYYSHPSHSR